MLLSSELGLYMELFNWRVSCTMKSHRVALGPTHHLPMVEPLRSEHLVESSQRELPLLEDAREPASCKSSQASLQPQLMLLLRPELPPPESTDNRVATAPPVLGMT